MHQRADLIYCYDGSLEGMLSCVFEAFAARERPFDILPEGRLEPSLFSVKRIASDAVRAGRVLRGIETKLGDDALYLIQNGLDCCHEHIELLMLDFLIFAFRRGRQAAGALGEKPVAELQRAVLALKREANSFIEFLRFSEYGGGLVSVIEPQNRVLPTIAPHFRDRFPNELFLIYDKTHQSALLHQKGRWAIADGVEGFAEPPPGGEERLFRELWGVYFDATAIEARINPKCQRGNLPLRYRRNMTEFTRGGQGAALPGKAAGTIPPPGEKRLLQGGG